MAMAAMNMVPAGWFLGVSFHLRRCPQTVASVPPNHLLLDSAPNLEPLISRWEMNKFENS
jgi:hypothetical protein